jgi:hypothetical protein
MIQAARPMANPAIFINEKPLCRSILRKEVRMKFFNIVFLFVMLFVLLESKTFNCIVYSYLMASTGLLLAALIVW